ncbi:hypothetical protein JCM19000A_38130 [Silvimonas sp. JCM 19000]
MPVLPRPRLTLTRRALTRMGLRVAVVIVLVTLGSYWHLYNSLQHMLTTGLANYAEARANHESQDFLLAQTQTRMLADEYLRRLKALGQTDPQAEFDAHFGRSPDGLIRVRPEISDFRHKATLFIRNDVPITPDLRRRVLTGYQLLSEWGPLTTNRFLDSFMNMPEQLSINYAPFVDWSLSATPSTNIFEYETVWRSAPKANPARKSFWTSVYFDEGARKWMISHVSLADLDGRWVGSLGQDIAIDDLVRRTQNTHLPGTWNLIVRSDGQLIAHPTLAKEIAKAGGNLDVRQLHDKTLENIVQAALSVPDGHGSATTPRGDYLVAVSTIAGPQWKLVVVYPGSLLASIARANASYVLLLGAASLLLELLIMWLVLQRHVAEPLQEMVIAAERIRDGEYALDLKSARLDDELGELARALAGMAERVGERDGQLLHAAKQLAREAELAGQTAARLEALSQILPDPVFLIDQHGVVREAFGKTAALFAGNPVAQNVFSTLPEDYHDLARTALQDALMRGAPHRLVYPVNTPLPARWFEARLMPLPSSSTYHWSVLWLVRDITELKQAAEETRLARDHLQDIVAAQTADLRAARDKADAANRAKTQFVSNISHELRTPMHAILSFARIGIEKAAQAEPDKLRRYFENIAKSGERMLATVNDLLDIAKLEAGKMDYHFVDTQLCHIVNTVVEELEPLAARRHVTMTVRGCDSDTVHCDSFRIAQVIRNLLSNSLKFSPSPGEIRVLMHSDGAMLHVGVCNDGPAIPDDELARIFESFVQGTATSPAGGSGLGLAICREIITAHGGIIHASNLDTGGVCFNFTLPITRVP